MKIPHQSAGVARNLCSGVGPRQQASRALVPAQIPIRSAFGNGSEPQPNGGEHISCRPCIDGFQKCTFSGQGVPTHTFTRECTSCGPCEQVCTRAGTAFTQSCRQTGSCCKVRAN